MRAAPRAVTFDFGQVLASFDPAFLALKLAERGFAGADVAACLSGAVGAMSGPLHGGAPSRVLHMIEGVEETGDATAYVKDVLDKGERLMGFGHRVYRAEDPRARVLRATCERLAAPRFEQVAVEQRLPRVPVRDAEHAVGADQHVQVDGVDVTNANARHSLDAGLGHIPEDRQRRGLVLDFSLAENLALHDYDHPPSSRFGWLYPKRLVAKAAKLIGEFDVRGGGPQTRAGGLSGGNQQKVVLAKWLATSPRVLVVDEPTRGIDVGAKQHVYALLRELAASGVAVFMVSSELPELIGMSDRVIVMRDGHMAGELPAGPSEEEVMALATGRDGEAAA